MLEILSARGTSTVEPVRPPAPDQLWITSETLAWTTGWKLRPEGLCSGDQCIPLREELRQRCIAGDRVDAAALWQALERPVLGDRSGTLWVLGESALERTERTRSLAAPDFELPDLAGRLHRLSDYRGKKVFLTTWASWCGCRLDLPIWQTLQESLAGAPFTVIAVAMDSRGTRHARHWIEQAKPSYPCLIDRNHLVSDLYHMVNVPQAVWIDEDGRIARPTEVCAASSSRDTEKRRDMRALYCDAIRDWVAKGPASAYVFSESDARSHLPAVDPAIAEAHGHFRLAERLWDRGQREEATAHFERAIELNPDSWNFFRQSKNLEHPAGSYGDAFFERVQAFSALGKRYYPAPDMPGMLEIARRS
jgi:peroxiredoxin